MTALLSPPPASIVAGTYYPVEPDRLRRDVRHHLGDAAEHVAPGTGSAPPKMLLVPHSQYSHSGHIAARAFVLLKPWADVVRRVVLLGPIHRQVVHGVAVPTLTSFSSPLGDVRLDNYALARLSAWPCVHVNDQALSTEHSLEVQLPFLQEVLGSFALLPLAVGFIEPRTVAELLATVWGGRETVVVVSSDLSNAYGPEEAIHRDRATVSQVLSLSATLDRTQACGAFPLNGALVAARINGLRPRLLAAAHSGLRGGEGHRVVGHTAVAFEAPADLDTQHPA